MLKDAFYRIFLLEELAAPVGVDYLAPYPYTSSSSFLQASSSKEFSTFYIKLVSFF
jgi:hypothetical protein